MSQTLWCLQGLEAEPILSPRRQCVSVIADKTLPSQLGTQRIQKDLGLHLPSVATSEFPSSKTMKDVYAAMFCRLSSLCACARACEWESTFSSQPGQSLRLRLENTNSFRWVCLVQCCLHKLAQAFPTNWNSDKSVSQIYVGEPGLNFRQHPNHVLSTGIQWKALQFLLRGSEAAKCHDLWLHCLWTLAMISSCHHWTSRLSSSAMCGAQHHAPRQKQSV